MPADFCFTIDLDRDVNDRVPGSPEAAISIDRGHGTEPRFESTLKGLAHYVSILEELDIPCTFFCEGRTLETIRDSAGLLDGFDIGVHGYDHEYFPEMARPDAVAAVRHGVEVVKDVLGRSPTAFRAPYMKMPRDIGSFLDGTGIRIDSSSYADASSCTPFMLPGYIAEVPVTETSDLGGRKMSAYLWPMHEGKRGPAEYADLASLVPDDGCYVLADHTWHMEESRASGPYPPGELEENVFRTRLALELILEAGCRPVSISEASSKACIRVPEWP